MILQHFKLKSFILQVLFFSKTEERKREATFSNKNKRSDRRRRRALQNKDATQRVSQLEIRIKIGSVVSNYFTFILVICSQMRCRISCAICTQTRMVTVTRSLTGSAPITAVTSGSASTWSVATASADS